MSRRLLKTKPGFALYEYDGFDGCGSYQVWEKLPFIPPRIHKAEPLEPPTQQVAGLVGGLYGDTDARRTDERRRKANAALEKFGVRPKRW